MEFYKKTSLNIANCYINISVHILESFTKLYIKKVVKSIISIIDASLGLIF